MIEQLSLLDVPPVEPTLEPPSIKGQDSLAAYLESALLLPELDEFIDPDPGTPIEYRRWQIATDSHEGKLASFSIRELNGQWYSGLTFCGPLEALDRSSAIAYAKGVIDQAIRLKERLSGQMSVFDLPTPAGVPELPTPEAPISVRFSAGDRVSIKPITCQGRTIHPWKSKAGTLKGLEGDTALVDFGVPGHPYPCRSDRLCEPVEAAEVSSELAPTQVFCEWRWWESTQRWTYTGRMGINDQPHHPNSEMFPYGVDPNEEMSRC